MDNGMSMMLKSFGIEKLLVNVAAEYLPKLEAIANSVKQRIDEYQAHVDARFDALEQHAQGLIPTEKGANQLAFEKQLEVNGLLLGVYEDGE